MELIYALLATLIVSLISFLGVFILISLKKFTKEGLLITSLVAFAAGSLIGDVFLHILPELLEVSEGGYSLNIGLGIIGGIFLMLLIESYFHCSHDSTAEIHSHHGVNKSLPYMNIVGDSIHNFLDGIAIAVSFLISPVLGLASTIAIVMHEIPQEIADASVLFYAGWSKKRVLIVNFLTALTSFLGVIFVFVFTNVIENLESFLLPVAIGQFLYIALADFLPVIHKKVGVKKYIVEIVAFILGVALMYSLTLLEIS